MNLTARRARVPLCISRWDAPIDQLSGGRLRIPRGCPFEVQFAIFLELRGKTLVDDFTNVTAVSMVLKAAIDTTVPPSSPAAGAAALFTASTATLNAALTATQWEALTAQHGTIALSASNTNQATGTYWAIFTATVSGQTITLGAGLVDIVEDGI
jgi:hypothetical protein